MFSIIKFILENKTVFTTPDDVNKLNTDNYGLSGFDSPAQFTPDKSYILKDTSKIFNLDNDGGKLERTDFTGPEQLSKEANNV